MRDILKRMQTETQLKNLTIHNVTPADIHRLMEMSLVMKAENDVDYFEKNLEAQMQGTRTLFIAVFEGKDAGYCIMNWEPKYPYFKVNNIPETQDINVLPDFRRRGFASAMIAHCEALARSKGRREIGIGVSVAPEFGPAQKLYTKLGYQPDGLGVSFDRKSIGPGEFKPVNEDLCLMMVKKLG